MEPGSGQLGGKICNHFSIRGFVADVRKKNKKECWPFPMVEQGELPALKVPDFKFWLCEKKRLNEEGINVDENEMISDLHSRGLKAGVTCAEVHLPYNENTPVLLSDSQQESAEEALEGKRAEDIATIIVNNVANNTPLCSDMQDGPPQSSRKESIGRKTADYVNKVRNTTPLCVNIQEKEAEVTEDDYPSRDDDVAAVKGNGFSMDEDDAAKNENEDACHFKGCDDNTVNCVKAASPELVGVKRKRKSMDAADVKKACNKKLGLGRTTMAKLNHKSKLPLILDDNECEISGSENTGNRQGKRKLRKSRKLDDILRNAPLSLSRHDYSSSGNKTAAVVETEVEESGSESEPSLGFDLNLSPTHQVVKEQKIIAIQDEDEEPLQMVFQKDGTENVQDAVVRDQHATFVTDDMHDSRKKKGKMPQYKCREPLPGIKLGDTLRGVQTANGNTQAECTGAEPNPFQPPKNASGGRAQRSDIKTAITRQSGGGEILRKKNKSGRSEVLGGKFPLLPPKRGCLPQMETGSSSSNRQLENLTTSRRPNISKQQCDQGTNTTSEQAGSDDIPMDIVELMAKNQYERRLGASGNSNYLSETPTDNVEYSNQAEKADVRGDEPFRFLHAEDFQKQKSQSINQGCHNNTETMRVGSHRPTQSVGYITQNVVSANRAISLPEQSHASRGFTSFSQNLERTLDGAQLLLGSSSRVFVDKNSPFSKNQEMPSSRAPFLAGSSSTDRNFTFSKNEGNPSNGREFLIGSSISSRNFANQSSAFSKDVEKSSSEAQLPIGGSGRFSGNQSLAFLHNRENRETRDQFLGSNSSRNYGKQNHNWSGKLEGHKYSQSNLLSSEGCQTPQAIPWENSFKDDRHAWSSMKENYFRLGIRNSANFAASSSAANKNSQCLNLFPGVNMDGVPSLKSTGLTTNHLGKRKRNLDLDATMGTHQEYPFGFRDGGYQFNPQPMRPVDLCNNDNITSATQLLKLMDSGVSPSRPINVDEDHNFSPQPSMPHQQRDTPRSGHSNNSAASLFLPSSNFLSGNPRYGKFVGNSSSVPDSDAVGPTAPTVPEGNRTLSSSAPEGNTLVFSASSTPKLNTVISSSQKNDIVRKDPGSSSIYSAQSIPNSPRYLRKVNGRGKEASAQSKSSRSNKPFSGNRDSAENRGFLYMQRGLISTPESMPSRTHPSPTKDSTKAGIVCEGSRNRMTETCVLNRNPADFEDPEAANNYMRGYGDGK